MADLDWADKKANDLLRPYFRGESTEHYLEDAVASALRDARREGIEEAALTIQARIDATDSARCTGTNCGGCELRRAQRLVRCLAEIVPALAAGEKAGG